MNDYLIYISIIIVVILVLWYFDIINLGLFGGSDNKTRKPKNTRKLKSTGSKSESSEVSEQAQNLYDKLHKPMVDEIDSDSYQEIMGNQADEILYMELSEMYTNAKQNNQNPEKSITPKDYQKILDKINE